MLADVDWGWWVAWSVVAVPALAIGWFGRGAYEKARREDEADDIWKWDDEWKE